MTIRNEATLYVYYVDTLEVVAVIRGDRDAVEKYAVRNYGDEEFGNTYSPAFGMNDGLRMGSETVYDV